MLISISEIIGQSWEFYLRQWRRLFPYMALMFLPTLILSVLGLLAFWVNYQAPATTAITGLVIVAVFAASMVFSLWLTVALARFIKIILDNQTPPKLGEMLASTSHLIWPVIYTSLLVGLIVLAGSILLIIPGIIFAVWYSFVFYHIAFEEKPGLTALRASKQMVVGRWWKILWRVLLPGLLFGVAMTIIDTVLLQIFGLFVHGETGLAIANSVISSLVNVFVTPLAAVAGIILYFSAKANPATANAPLPPQS